MNELASNSEASFSANDTKNINQLSREFDQKSEELEQFYEEWEVLHEELSQYEE